MTTYKFDSELRHMYVWCKKNSSPLNESFDKMWARYLKACIINKTSRDKLKTLFDLRQKDSKMFLEVMEDASKEHEEIFKERC